MTQNDRAAFKILCVGAEKRIVAHRIFNHVGKVLCKVFVNKQLVAECVGSEVYFIAAEQFKTFRNNNDSISVSAKISAANNGNYLIIGFREFGNKYKMGICGKSCLQCDPARVPPHAFDNDAAGMSLCGRLQAINGLHCNVGGGFKAESVIGTAQIIVYGFRNADNVHAEFAQRIRNAESVVPADGDKTFKPECIKHVDDC